MLLTSSHGKIPFVIFIGILLLGAVLITIAYRSSQSEPPKEPVPEEMTVRQRELASSQGEMSKWLLGLASGAIAAVLALRLKDPQNDDLVGPLPMAAYAFLILSLYGAFLSYDATTNILRVGPLSYLYGDQFRFPVLVQFWSLIAALIFLGIWLFRPRRKAAMLLLLLVGGAVPTVKAQDLDPKPCIEAWYKDRLRVKEESSAIAVRVIHKIEKQPHAKPVNTCIDLDSILDQLRFAEVQAGKADTQSGFDAYLKGLDEELSHPNLSTSDVIHSIIQIMSPWDQQLAVLSIRAEKDTYQILINANQVGVTNWTRRLPAGTYSIRVVRNFQVAYSSDSLQLTSGDSKLIDLDKPK